MSITLPYCFKLQAPKTILVFILFFSVKLMHGRKPDIIPISSTEISLSRIDTVMFDAEADFSVTDKRPNPLLHLFKAKQRKNKRITAAILAFPFPFGIVGLHRIYLGTAPHVPVVYIGSLGGVIGILPFIDFCILLFDKDIERYNENKKIFMWVE